MVAEVTGLDVKYIWEELPLAHGRQYEQIFYAVHDIECVPIRAEQSAIETTSK